jgi:hypothetical protein
MKPLVVLVLLILLLPAVGHARGYEMKKEAGEYELEIKIDKNPVILGKNTIEVGVKNGGRTIMDAKVLVNYYMPPMPRMAPMNYVIHAKPNGHKYQANMDIIMTGPWIIVIKIFHGEKRATARLNVDAQ